MQGSIQGRKGSDYLYLRPVLTTWTKHPAKEEVLTLAMVLIPSYSRIPSIINSFTVHMERRRRAFQRRGIGQLRIH